VPREVTSCAVCGAVDSAADARATYHLSLAPPFEIRVCRRCRLRWLNPQPTEQEYARFYREAYFRDPADAGPVGDLFAAYPAPPVDYEHDTMPLRLRFDAERLRRLRRLLPHGRTLCDVGAGMGDFLVLAAREGWDVYGIEVSAYGCRRAREKYGLVLEQTEVASYDPRGRTFDVVHLSHVFEHFTDPVAALGHLRRLMHAQSLLAIEVPNQFESLVDWTRKVKDGPMKRSLYSIHHPYFYGRGQLVRLLSQYGFRVVEACTHFPERWATTWRGRVHRFLDYVGDLLGGHGDNIEVIAAIR
jgi:ubiquinone/menaquinone biosynthesis C-methylase UbiE